MASHRRPSTPGHLTPEYPLKLNSQANESEWPGLSCSSCMCTSLMQTAPDLWGKSVSFLGGMSAFCDQQAGDYFGFIGMQAGAVAIVVIFNAVMASVTQFMAKYATRIPNLQTRHSTHGCKVIQGLSVTQNQTRVQFFYPKLCFCFCRFERHATVAEEEASIAWSVFGGQFINTALVGLLVYARIQSVYDQVTAAAGPQGAEVMSHSFPCHWDGVIIRSCDPLCASQI
jgi:hypothetical protein